MEFKKDPIINLTIPSTAGPGDARIVIGPDLPPPLDTYSWSDDDTPGLDTLTPVTGIIYYPDGDDTTYTYEVTCASTLPIGNIVMRGWVQSGAVVEAQGTVNDYPMGDFWYSEPLIPSTIRRIVANELILRTQFPAVGGLSQLYMYNTGAPTFIDRAELSSEVIELSATRAVSPTTDGIQVTGTAFVSFQAPTSINVYSAAGAANPRLSISAGGTLSWGAGGGTAVDSNLYRQAASLLQSDDRISQRRMMAVYTQTVALVIATGAAGAVGQYNTTVADFWNIGQVAGVFTIPANFAGVWTVTSSVAFSLIAAPAGFRLLQLRHNGVSFAESRVGANPIANQPTSLCVSQSDFFNVGDTIDVFLLHTQGVNLTYGGAGIALFTTTITFEGRSL